jgi:tellurium resistance protein TerD
VSGLNKGVGKIQVDLAWDPSPLGAPPHDLDLVAATYPADDPHGRPAYLVHFDSRSPDGTIILNRDSHDGKGFGADEVMTLEFGRVPATYGRVVVGVVIQQREQHVTFGEVRNTTIRIAEGYTELAQDDFATVSTSTAATVAEFVRDKGGIWRFEKALYGFDTDPSTFADLMGGISS